MALNKRQFVNGQVYPLAVKWEIEEEKLRNLGGVLIRTPHMILPFMQNVKFYVSSGRGREGNSFYVYLSLIIPNNMRISANAHISCETANSSDWFVKEYTESHGWGLPICQYEDLFDPEKKFMVNKKFVVSVTATLTIVNTDPIPSKTAKIDSLGWKLWDSEDDKDATVVVNRKEIKVHKCVLKRRSQKFEALFKVKPEPTTKKKTEGDKIVVKNHTYDTVKEAIMFCYDIQSSDSLSAEDATDLMIFADKYEIMDLKVIFGFFMICGNTVNKLQEIMEEFCIEKLSVANVCTFANVSDDIHADKLYQKCFDFLSKCMKDGTAVKDAEKLNENMQKKLFLNSFVTTVVDTI